MKKTALAILGTLTMVLMFAISSHALSSGPTTTNVVHTWSNPTTNCDGSTYIDPYATNVYLASTPTGSYTKIATVMWPNNSFTETVTIPNNTTILRCLMVRAVDVNGNESCADSNQVCESFFGLDTLFPAGITNFK